MSAITYAFTCILRIWTWLLTPLQQVLLLKPSFSSSIISVCDSPAVLNQSETHVTMVDTLSLMSKADFLSLWNLQFVLQANLCFMRSDAPLPKWWATDALSDRRYPNSILTETTIVNQAGIWKNWTPNTAAFTKTERWKEACIEFSKKSTEAMIAHGERGPTDIEMDIEQ